MLAVIYKKLSKIEDKQSGVTRIKPLTSYLEDLKKEAHKEINRQG